MTSGELGQSSGSDLYCSVVQAVTTGHQYVLPSQVWLLTAWKSTCKREILVERKVAYNQNASNLEREWIQWLPKPNSEDSAWLWEFLKGKGEVLSGGHWDGRSELLPSPTACRLRCRFINFLWFSLYAIVFTQFVCGITAGKAREEIWSPDNYLFLISVSLIYGKNQQIRWGASLVAQMVKNLPAMQETWVWSLGWEDPLEKGMAIHSTFLPGEFHRQRSLVGYSPWACKELDGNWATNADCVIKRFERCVRSRDKESMGVPGLRLVTRQKSASWKEFFRSKSCWHKQWTFVFKKEKIFTTPSTSAG